MAITDVRQTVLQTVNAVLQKLGLNEVTSLVANKISRELINHINDVVDDLSDFGNWQETLTTANVTCQSSVDNYQIATSGVVKNIGDIFLTTRQGPLQSVDVKDMRIMTRVTARGQPSQYCVFGTDSNGNPNIRVRPIPTSNEDGSMFSILYFVKPSLYTTADASTIIPFPSRVVILGTLARYTLRESGGAVTDMYKEFQQQYLSTRKTSLNRFNSNTGWDLSFVPSRANRWRR